MLGRFFPTPVLRNRRFGKVGCGVSIVMFSGDKLLGGPQAGLLRATRNWLSRATTPSIPRLRVDKLTTAALAATLGAICEVAVDEIPALRMIRMSVQGDQAARREFSSRVDPGTTIGEVELEIADGSSLAGGGSTPTQSLPTEADTYRQRSLLRVTA